MYLPQGMPLLVPRYESIDIGSAIKEGLYNQDDLDEYNLPPLIIYHYTSIEKAKLIIEGQKLRFSCPNDFNDPFDMYEGLIDYSGTPKQIREWANKAFADKRRSDRRRLTKLANNSALEFERFRREQYAELKLRCGVCCFSKSYLVNLMWSHYAQYHKGVCLGFNIHPIRGQDFFIREVNYAHQIKKENLYDLDHRIISHYVFTKSHIWSYEQEVRAVLIERPESSLVGFARDCLREVYFGCKTSKSDMIEILDLLEKKKYNLTTQKKMYIDESIFDIKPSDLDILNTISKKA
ncbi:DUF2971 domain-containing protein [Spirosoma aureum]|uniref:DUF2971 domain-containing protein n=1 Tax=Spirosoma aureum TaxID=2692134 RepID=A0A6G9AWX4_9BACT|nr:DUF2971 domain-containing protein [Spirosoma aureum]QIP16846.1 DUF2971 domain-containing protein [Spirosoma aureum]